MSDDVFGDVYAAAYDALYGDKDYGRECDSLERMFAEFGPEHVTDVLDLGCGTGSHAVVLAERGYSVTGVDRSPQMLQRAEDKARSRGQSLDLEFGDLTSFRNGRQYDAVLMMFAVLGYQRSNEHVAAALDTVRAHLRPGGVFVADFWYGPAVLGQRPNERAAIKDDGPDDLLIRIARPELDVLQHLCHVDYRVIEIRGGRLTRQGTERHTMRFFFPQELAAGCEAAQIQLRRLFDFPGCEREPGPEDWNALLVGTAT